MEYKPSDVVNPAMEVFKADMTGNASLPQMFIAKEVYTTAKFLELVLNTGLKWSDIHDFKITEESFGLQASEKADGLHNAYGIDYKLDADKVNRVWRGDLGNLGRFLVDAYNVDRVDDPKEQNELIDKALINNDLTKSLLKVFSAARAELETDDIRVLSADYRKSLAEFAKSKRSSGLDMNLHSSLNLKWETFSKTILTRLTESVGDTNGSLINPLSEAIMSKIKYQFELGSRVTVRRFE